MKLSVSADAAAHRATEQRHRHDGRERLSLVREELKRARLTGLMCTLPKHVLLLSGYWPAVGGACAIVWHRGPAVLVVPDDELHLADTSWANRVHGVRVGSDAYRLATELASLTTRRRAGRIGLEYGPSIQPASYVAMRLYGASLWDVGGRAWPHATLVAADDVLANLCARKTRAEISAITTACRVAGRAFMAARAAVRVGAREVEVAAKVRTEIMTAVVGRKDRVDGDAFCMAGPNSAHAHRAYAQSTARRLRPGDLVLVHCNAHVNGYWTDVTRTYCLGPPDQRQLHLYHAVFAARRAALDAIRPGVRAGAIDQVVREVLGQLGLGAVFKHSTGHGVGFSAIDHDARPRLAPASDDVLQPGMVCNIEPAVYIDGYGGLRHCDVVAVSDSGARLLTPFHRRIEDLVLPEAGVDR